MTLADLKAKYGKNKEARVLINRAIRAELVGGNEALDALDALRNRADEPTLQRLRAIVSAMADEIRRRYGLGEGDGGTE